MGAKGIHFFTLFLVPRRYPQLTPGHMSSHMTDPLRAISIDGQYSAGIFPRLSHAQIFWALTCVGCTAEILRANSVCELLQSEIARLRCVVTFMLRYSTPVE